MSQGSPVLRWRGIPYVWESFLSRGSRTGNTEAWVLPECRAQILAPQVVQALGMTLILYQKLTTESWSRDYACCLFLISSSGNCQKLLRFLEGRKQKRKKTPVLATLLQGIVEWEMNGRNKKCWTILHLKICVISLLSFPLWLIAKYQWPLSISKGQNLLPWVTHLVWKIHLNRFFSCPIQLMSSVAIPCYSILVFAGAL
jgi:hypothetical protein